MAKLCTNVHGKKNINKSEKIKYCLQILDHSLSCKGCPSGNCIKMKVRKIIRKILLL